MIGTINITISRCTTGIYLRWWYNGYHYFNFTNGYEITMSTESMGTQVTKMFSRISKVERPTKLKAEYSYQITLEGITAGDIPGFESLLLAEKVEQYESGVWREVKITRGEHVTKDENAPGYILNFEITRKELPNTPAVFQKSQHLYINDTECDLDEDEIIPINKQVNDIAEMQDRQSDFTAQFKIRKTRAMRALFELSGEVGANTTFPYEKQNCRYVNSGIEMITGGYMILDKGDDQYYYASIYSGNLNFFKEIEGKKLSNLTLAGANHTWDAITAAASNAGDLDYVYPLCEPSDDGAISPLTDDGSRVEMYAGWIWPFIKAKTIWDEIFTNVSFTCLGDILTDPKFLKLFMPIVNRSIGNTILTQYYYGLTNSENKSYPLALNTLPGGTLIIGTPLFAGGVYLTPFTGTYKFSVTVITSIYLSDPQVYVRDGITDTELVTNSDLTRTIGFVTIYVHEGSYTALSGVSLTFLVTPCQLYYYDILIVDIKATAIGYASPVVPHLNLPDMSQIDFVKMICNIFGLIPDTTARDKKILFWNYSDLYDNIPIARDWSAYLSEQEDETEFKFGDYAQNNYLRYKDSDDVIKDNGRGNVQVNDDTLPLNKDILELPVSTCDEVTVLTDVDISRIAFNKYDSGSVTYKQENSIDPRIVYVDNCANTKTFGLRNQLIGGISYDTVSPRKANSLEVSFSYFVANYAWLSRMLTKTNLRRAKFNLPVYEVAGLKHYIPIYLNQYKAYFYVNKINNYVPGQLCTIDLIKL